MLRPVSSRGKRNAGPQVDPAASPAAAGQAYFMETGVLTGTCADIANLDPETGRIVSPPSLHFVGSRGYTPLHGWGLYGFRASRRPGLSDKENWRLGVRAALDYALPQGREPGTGYVLGQTFFTDRRTRAEQMRHLLDYNAPIGEQRAKTVAGGLKGLGYWRDGGGVAGEMAREWCGEVAAEISAGKTGQEIYGVLARELPDYPGEWPLRPLGAEYKSEKALGAELASRFLAGAAKNLSF